MRQRVHETDIAHPARASSLLVPPAAFLSIDATYSPAIARYTVRTHLHQQAAQCGKPTVGTLETKDGKDAILPVFPAGNPARNVTAASLV